MATGEQTYPTIDLFQEATRKDITDRNVNGKCMECTMEASRMLQQMYKK